jgi:predicted O-methyltransferase YrrM
MDNELWNAVDDHLVTTLVPDDDVLAAALADSDAAGLPQIQVAANQGKLLSLLVRISGARRVLEVGTLGGYSTIWLARGLPADGVVVTLELEEHNAGVARRNLERAGLDDQVEVRVGPAADTLAAMVDAGSEPFDLVFLDADKGGYPTYLARALDLSRPGTVIVADNVVRGGAVADATTTDPNAVGVRRFLEAAAADPRVDGTAVQTVGSKGHDGFALLVVTDAP